MPFLLAEYPGTTRFATALQTTDASENAPKQVKTIFTSFLKTIAAKKPCIVRADLKCIIDTFKDIVIPGMEQGISSTQGPSKEMFRKLLRLDHMLVTELSALPESAGKTGVNIADKILDKKATVVNQYQKGKQ